MLAVRSPMPVWCRSKRLRPNKGQIDKYGRAIPDDECQTKDFERVISLQARIEAIARHLPDFMKKTDGNC